MKAAPIKPGIATRKQRPPLHKRLLILVPGWGWRTGYFAEYQGRPHAVIDGMRGHWHGKRWSPLVLTTETGGLVSP